MFFFFFCWGEGRNLLFSFIFLTQMAKQVGEFYSVDSRWGLQGLHDAAST